MSVSLHAPMLENTRKNVYEVINEIKPLKTDICGDSYLARTLLSLITPYLQPLDSTCLELRSLSHLVAFFSQIALNMCDFGLWRETGVPRELRRTNSIVKPSM